MQQNIFSQHVYTCTTYRKVDDDLIMYAHVPKHMGYMPIHSPLHDFCLSLPWNGQGPSQLFSALRAEGGDNVSVLTYCSELTPSQSACTNVYITYIHHNEQGKTIQTSWNS